jgi:hypothetical protein
VITELRQALADEWAALVRWMARPGPPSPGEATAITILLLAIVLLATCEAPR